MFRQRGEEKGKGKAKGKGEGVGLERTERKHDGQSRPRAEQIDYVWEGIVT